MFGYYNLIGYLAQASGSAFAGVFISYSQNNCSSEFEAITNLVRLYALLGGVMFVLYFLMNRDTVEADHPQ